MTQETANRVADEVFELYQHYGNADYISEPVSQIEHMCQAAQMAEGEGYDDEVILAAFFHDIGHLCEHLQPVEHMEAYGIVDHEQLGGDYLREKGFSEKIARLVASHVSAKRYLTYKHPEYFDRLSEASKATLQMQGGPMSDEEGAAFEADPLHPLYITIREWDDKAKVEEQPLPSLENYKKMAIAHLLSQP